MKNKKIFTIILIAVVAILSIRAYNTVGKKTYSVSPETSEIETKKVKSEISAEGQVASENQATLNFQTPGKLVYLPFKEGDKVTQGQTIASLDTYILQRQLSAALNSYRSTRDTFDQVQQNADDNQLQANQQPFTSSAKLDKNTAINDAVKRIVDQNQANLDNSIINVELANYALQLATLTSPINGVILHQDVTVSGVNITPQNLFIVADPASLVFKANVDQGDIDYVKEGSPAKIKINGDNKVYTGVVYKIYPQKITLQSGAQVYQVDIKSDGMQNNAKLQQSGSVMIANSQNSDTTLVPSWTVLGHQYIWIETSGRKLLKKITVGKDHGAYVEILGGLDQADKVIIDPESIAVSKYQIL